MKRTELIDRFCPARQLTHGPRDHVLTNVNVFSPDSHWIVYDTRSAQGERFDCDRIERVNVETGEVQGVYEARAGAKCGVATYDTRLDRIAFILGPDASDPDFTYGPARRQGKVVDLSTKNAWNLDARDITPPYTPGALRGGTHVHVFSPDGTRVSSTYEDHVLDQPGPPGRQHNQRNVAVSVLGRPVKVPAGRHAHDGESFSVVVTETVDHPRPGSDEISRAYEEGWIGRARYVKSDGTRQKHALAFQGDVVLADGQTIAEVFVVDLPDDLTTARPRRPIEGTPTTRPAPPAGCSQRRLTFTGNEKYPGIAGPRHWLRCAPDGSNVAYLAKDERGRAQLHLAWPNGGTRRLTNCTPPVASAFTWCANGRLIAHHRTGSVCITDITTGDTFRLTRPAAVLPRPTACVFSPDGRWIAYVLPTPCPTTARDVDQIWLVELPAGAPSGTFL